MVLTIDGVDMTPYIAYKGVTWKRNDIDAPNTGRAMDGFMYRGRVTTKIRLDVKCKPLTTEQAAIVLTAIMPEFVTVTYTDPQVGGEVTKTMYANNNPASYLLKDENHPELDLWDGITFPLVER